MTPPTAEGGALRSRRSGARRASRSRSTARSSASTRTPATRCPTTRRSATPTPNRRRIVAYGMRNPFRFTFRPGTSEIWFGDVGWNTWEEINRIPDPLSPTVRNFGWPCYEGDGRMAAYDTLNLNSCESLYTQGASAVTPPYFHVRPRPAQIAGDRLPGRHVVDHRRRVLHRQPVPGRSTATRCSSPTTRAAASSSCPRARTGCPTRATAQVFAAGAAGPVDIQMGPDGALYYVDLEGGTIRRIAYPAGNDTPTARATATPDHGPTPLHRRVRRHAARRDPDGDALTYSWDLDGDGTFGDATVANAAFTYTTPGNYTAQLRVTDPGGATDTIDASRSRPATPPVADDRHARRRASRGPPATRSRSPARPSTARATRSRPPACRGSSTSGTARAPTRRPATRTSARRSPASASGTFDRARPRLSVAPRADPDRDRRARPAARPRRVALQPKTVDITLASTPDGRAAHDRRRHRHGAVHRRRSSRTSTTDDHRADAADDRRRAVRVLRAGATAARVTHTITVPRTDTTYTATFARSTEVKLGGRRRGRHEHLAGGRRAAARSTRPPARRPAR